MSTTCKRGSAANAKTAGNASEKMAPSCGLDLNEDVKNPHTVLVSSELVLEIDGEEEVVHA